MLGWCEDQQDCGKHLLAGLRTILSIYFCANWTLILLPLLGSTVFQGKLGVTLDKVLFLVWKKQLFLPLDTVR